jgi:hypothetical protein
VTCAAICVDGRYWELAQVAREALGDAEYSGLMSVFQDWAANEARLQRAADDLASGASLRLGPVGAGHARPRWDERAWY